MQKNSNRLHSSVAFSSVQINHNMKEKMTLLQILKPDNVKLTGLCPVPQCLSNSVCTNSVHTKVMRLSFHVE